MADTGVPDTAPIFEEPNKSEFGKWCGHERFTVISLQRRVECSLCQAVLDPFDIVESQARRQRIREDVDGDIKNKREQLKMLCAEEKRVKARTRNARKKDADAAVSAAMKKAEEDHSRAIFNLISARQEIAVALRQLGHTQEDWTDA